ncbi:hypothetical protein A1O3_02546 [Capronia epimyces CBS 606.96]|uniref:AAA+ ATPase domain-containing protein n=1 Tax=Capronia epimyces CBS 606.96 TaxID=1182542 RepID=W9Z4R6_9EURO|nr:uncharacterized protein A1O3_02546 [Capronia epimyces CBS 606.96]EXJ89479.1 hypothetical protein A1O3_02546 [Capronia epimyces CBS 606.96]
MHSTLHAELRFTQILKSTCRQCARQQSSRTRSFHSGPRIRAPQEPANNASSVNGVDLGDDAKNVEVRSEVAREKPKFEETKSQVNQQRTTPTDPPSDNADQPQVQSFYGSSAKRRLRSRMLKETEPEHKIPEWLLANNIHLYGEGTLAVGASSRIQVVPADLITGEPLDHTSPSSPNGNPRDPNAEDQESVLNQRSSFEAADGFDAASPDAGELSPIKSGQTPSSGKRYHVIDEQYEEVERTARGLMQLSRVQTASTEVEFTKSHLLLQYAGKDGDLLLDHVVEDLARNLGCDLMVLDAQDIADLISRSNQQSRVAKAGRMLSYDVFTNAYPTSSEVGQAQLSREEDEDDEDLMDDFESAPSPPQMGMPVFIGKPISIDLKTMFGSQGRSTRSDIPISPMKLVSDMLNMNTGSASQETTRPFAGVVDSLLTSFLERRLKPAGKGQSQSSTRSLKWEELREYTARQTGVPKDAAIIHVKDLESIQETSIGNQFLQELYRQVVKRRISGASILLVGTDCAREDQEPFTKQRINDTQTGERDEISHNIVLTPVLPNTTSKLALLHDRKQRIATVNMRHLWEMMRYRKPAVFAHLEPGFWRRDFFNHVTRSDRSCLEAQIWNYSYVQRLATYIAGAAPLISNIPGITDKKELQDSLAAVQGASEPVISAATAHLNHSDKTKIRWAEKQEKETKIELPEQQKTKEDVRLAGIRASASKYEKRLMGGIIEAENIKTTFNDVHMPVETIDTLQTLTTLSLIRPDAFKYGVLASDKIPGLLLYGPPGTGKTLAAKAVAKESGATMLEVSAADINDMYVGEGEKNVKALFGLAKKLSPCVVFLDEADAMFSARSNQGRRVSHRELLNQFLKEWDGMSNDSGSAFIMVATNRPMDLDDAVLRRLPRRLLVDLPTEPDRLEILKIHLRHEILAEDVDLAVLAKNTPFYSGSDLKNVAVAAAMNCVREENALAKKHTGEEPYKHPERRTLYWKHFEKALDEISASISEDMSSLREIKKFDEQFGDKRGKKKKAPRLGFPTQEEEKGRDTVKVRQ